MAAAGDWVSFLRSLSSMAQWAVSPSLGKHLQRWLRPRMISFPNYPIHLIMAICSDSPRARLHKELVLLLHCGTTATITTTAPIDVQWSHTPHLQAPIFRHRHMTGTTIHWMRMSATAASMVRPLMPWHPLHTRIPKDSSTSLANLLRLQLNRWPTQTHSQLRMAARCLTRSQLIPRQLLLTLPPKLRWLSFEAQWLPLPPALLTCLLDIVTSILRVFRRLSRTIRNRSCSCKRLLFVNDLNHNPHRLHRSLRTVSHKFNNAQTMSTLHSKTVHPTLACNHHQWLPMLRTSHQVSNLILLTFLPLAALEIRYFWSYFIMFQKC